VARPRAGASFLQQEIQLRGDASVQLKFYIDILERFGFSTGRRVFVWDINGDEVPYDFPSSAKARRSHG
jgi:hypothetical protein